jgi:hypothetical protein
MHSLSVGNVYKPQTHKGMLVYIGRKSSWHKAPYGALNLNVLGNPFEMITEAQRSTVCQQYDQWLHAEYWKEKQVYNAVQEIIKLLDINDITLLCFCHPKECHADNLRAFIYQIVDQSE